MPAMLSVLHKTHLISLLFAAFIHSSAVGAYDPKVGFAMGIYGPITEITQDDLAVAILFDLDLRKHREPELMERLGPPIIDLPHGLHPDLKFKVQVGASNGEKTTGMATALDWLYGQNGTQKVVGIVGGYYSTISMPVAATCEVFKTPQIAFGSTNRQLSDKTLYPWFLRTIAPDNLQGQAMWAWMHVAGVPSIVFFFRSLEPYGEGLFQASLDEAFAVGQPSRVSGVGVELTGDLNGDKTAMLVRLDDIKALATKFIILAFSSPTHASMGMYVMEQQNMLYSSYQILGSDSLGIVQGDQYKPSRGYPQGLMKIIPVTAGKRHDKFAHAWHRMTPDDIYSPEARSRYMIDSFRVPVDNARTPKLNASDFIDRLPWFFSNFLFDAAYTLAVAINNLLHAGLPPDQVYGEPLLKELRNSSFGFEGVTGPVGFDENADRIADWELWNVDREGGSWQSVAIWLAKASNIVESFRFHDIDNLQFTWVTGDVSVQAPKALTACAFGQRWDATAGLCIFCQVNEQAVHDESGDPSCRPCDLGSVSDELLGALNCSECEPGTFRDSTSPTCTPCEAGTFAEHSGQSACKDCPAGQFAASMGAFSCEKCSGSQPLRFTTMERIPDSNGQQTLSLKSGADSVAFCGCRPGYREDGLGGCVPCKEGMVCQGLNETTIASGYFADVMSPTGELSVYQCFGDTDRCAGGLPGRTCRSGRKGLTCSECQDGKTPASDGSCVDCQGSDIGPLLSVLALGVLSLTCAYSFVDTQNRATQSHALLLAACAGGQLVTLIQQLSVIGKLHNNWEDPIKPIVEVLQVLAFDLEVLRPNCVGSVSPLQKFSIKITAIFIIIGLMLMIHGAFVSLRHKCQWHNRLPSLIASIGMLFLVFNISVTAAVLEPFQCEQHPNRKWTVKPFPSVLCWDDDMDHTKMVVGGAVAFIFVPVVFIAACYMVVKQFPKKVKAGDSEFLRSFSFLFFRFRASQHWYVFYQILRNFGVALVLLIPEATVQAFVLAFILLLGFSCALYLWPWRVDYANIVECIFGGGSILFAFLAALFLESERKHLEATAWVAAAVVCLLLVCTPTAVAYGLYLRYCRSKKPFQFFLCHHKNGSGAFVRLLKMHLQESSQLRSDIFVDSDNLDNLDCLFDHVGNDTESLVVICTELIFTRAWCVGEMCVARLKKVSLLVVTLPGHALPDDASIPHLLDSIADMDVLTENGMSEDIIAKTLRWVPKHPAISLPNAVTPQIMDMAASRLFLGRACDIDESMKAKMADSLGNEAAQNVMIFDDSNMEAAASAWILRKLLAPLLTHDTQKLPRPIENVDCLRQVHQQAVILILCTQGIFDSEVIMQFFVRITTLFHTSSLLPLICDQSFTVMHAKSFRRSVASNQMSTKELEAVSSAITALFKEIAVYFLAQYSSLDVLDVAAKAVAKRLLTKRNSGATPPPKQLGGASTSVQQRRLSAGSSSSQQQPGVASTVTESQQPGVASTVTSSQQQPGAASTSSQQPFTVSTPMASSETYEMPPKPRGGSILIFNF